MSWTAAYQASLSLTSSRSLLKLMSTELVMPSDHLFLCHPLLLQSSIFPSIRVFSMSQFFTSGGQCIGASAPFLPMNIPGWSSCYPRDFQESSPAPQFESINSSVLELLYGLSHPYLTTGETIALPTQTFCQQSDVSAF